jgi:hypothetical protein
MVQMVQGGVAVLKVGSLYRVGNTYYRIDWRPGELMLCTGITRNVRYELEYTVLRATGLERLANSNAIGFLKLVAECLTDVNDA